jgi:hypothetical protein
MHLIRISVVHVPDRISIHHAFPISIIVHESLKKPHGEFCRVRDSFNSEQPRHSLLLGFLNSLEVGHAK